MAIATGVCDGLALGLNARAALMTRGLAEITRLGVRMGDLCDPTAFRDRLSFVLPYKNAVLTKLYDAELESALAGRIGALALVTGDSLGQVSSQTLANLDTINRAATLPVLRPLIGRDKEEIVRRAREIGSFALSIEAADDCCSFLMPRNPATWTRPEPIDQIEARLDVAGLVEATLARVEEERIEPDP